MFTTIASLNVDTSPPLKGAALLGFREAVANWQHIARLEAGKAENPSELLFSDHISREIETYAGCLTLEHENVARAQGRYTGRGRIWERTGDELTDDQVFVARGIKRLQTIFEQAQIVNQDLLPDYIEASRARLKAQTRTHPLMGMEAAKFVENAHLLRSLPAQGVMDAFTHVEIEAQCAQAMRYFKSTRKNLDERRQLEAFWGYISDVASDMHISAHGAFMYKPSYFPEMLTLSRKPLRLVKDN